MDARTLQYLDDARQRIIAAMASTAARSQGFDEVVMVAQQAFSQVLPQLPGMIAVRVPEGDARIFTAVQLQRLLAEFAADMLALQTNDLIRAVRPRQVEAQPKGQ